MVHRVGEREDKALHDDVFFVPEGRCYVDTVCSEYQHE